MADQEFKIEMLFKALADPTRLRLIKLLGDEEVCVCSCVKVLNTHQSKVSRHLAYLRRAGLVATRRDGKWIYYRLVNPSNPRALKIFTEVRHWLATSAADS
jgi:ArsR family transcriptional regulator, arsenate/arsenite/antimonite-responsive transcriptional repressor